MIRGGEKRVPVPSGDECFALMREMGMMEHIVSHSRQVCRVALFLAQSLLEQGFFLDRELVRAAALLHDITKTKSLRTGENHARTGALLLEARGYPEVGKIIGEHVRLSSYEASQVPDETEIINYADKRVLHERITSLRERMEYILERYGREPGDVLRIRNTWEMTKTLEARLFRFLPFSPDDLTELLNGGDSRT